MTEYYTVAKKQSQCYGHGDYIDEFHIVTMVHTFDDLNRYPPLFKTKAEANEYRNNIKWNSDYVVVSLHLEE